MSAPAFSVDQVVGKWLKTLHSVAVYDNPAGRYLRTVPAGQYVGQVDTYVYDSAGSLWWSFLDTNGNSYYVKHVVGAFDTSDLQGQGALSVPDEIAKQQQTINDIVNPLAGLADTVKTGATSLFSAITPSFGTILLLAAGVGAIYIIVKKVL